MYRAQDYRLDSNVNFKESPFTPPIFHARISCVINNIIGSLSKY